MTDWIEKIEWNNTIKEIKKYFQLGKSYLIKMINEFDLIINKDKLEEDKIKKAKYYKKILEDLIN